MALALSPQKLNADTIMPVASGSMLGVGASIAIAGAFCAVVLAGMYLYELDSRTAPLSFRAAGETQVAHAASVVTATSSAAAHIREVHIANDGLVFLRGAQVTAISDDTIQVSVAWGSATFSWAIKTSHNTSFFGSDGEKSTLSGIAIGQYLSSVTGAVIKNAAVPMVEATFVRS